MAGLTVGGLRIVEPGIATTVQDGGRPGLAHLGIPVAGAVDPTLAGLLNRVLGNRSDAPVLETAGGLVLEATATVTVATTHHAGPSPLRPGERIVVPAGRGRQWHYVAVRGGLDVPRVLGSCSHDTLSGLGPPPLVAGTELAVGDEPLEPVGDLIPIGPVADVARIDVGPRADWFASDVVQELARRPVTVAATSRIGVRLHGARIRRTRHDELPSEGLVRGAIQVPADGDPIMMLCDHPTTGGYPVAAVVHPDDVAIVAQHIGGTTLRLRG